MLNELAFVLTISSLELKLASFYNNEQDDEFGFQPKLNEIWNPCPK